MYLPSTLPCSHVSLLLHLVSSFSCQSFVLVVTCRHTPFVTVRWLVPFPSRTLESGVWERDCTLNGCCAHGMWFRSAPPIPIRCIVDAHTYRLPCCNHLMRGRLYKLYIVYLSKFKTETTGRPQAKGWLSECRGRRIDRGSWHAHYPNGDATQAGITLVSGEIAASMTIIAMGSVLTKFWAQDNPTGTSSHEPQNLIYRGIRGVTL